MTRILSHILMPEAIITQPTAAVKQTTEPTDRSMLPPVRMHISIPVASTKTYAFSAIRPVRLEGRRIIPSLPFQFAKTMVTTTRAIIIVYFWKKAPSLYFCEKSVTFCFQLGEPLIFSSTVMHPFLI